MCMLHMRWDKPSMLAGGGILQGVVGENPACMLGGVYEGWTGEALMCSTTVLPWCHLQTGDREHKRGCDKRVRIKKKKKRSK